MSYIMIYHPVCVCSYPWLDTTGSLGNMLPDNRTGPTTKTVAASCSDDPAEQYILERDT